MASPGRLDITVSNTGGIDRTSAALADAEHALPGNILKEVRQVARRLANIASRRVQSEPTHTGRHTGLRADIAAGVGTRDTEAGAMVTTSVPQHSEAIIPRGLDGHGWRHPVWGHDRWVVQHGAFSWFLDSMQGGRTDGEQNLERLLNETAEKIARAA